MNGNIIILKYAEISEFGKVKDFYSDAQRRTRAVYLRDDAVLESQINRKLFLTARNSNNQIIAGAGLCSLAQGERIDCIATDSGQVIEQGIAVELTSVLKSGKGNNDFVPPAGIWNQLLFGIPMIMACDRAGSKDLPMDILIADVQTDRVNTINHITGAQSTSSPLRWELIKPADQLVKSFKDTTSDENVSLPKNFYRAPIRNIYAVASFLLDCSNKKFISNHLGERVYIDFSALELQRLMELIINKDWYIRSFTHKASWSEMRRILETVTKNDMPTNSRSRAFGATILVRIHMSLYYLRLRTDNKVNIIILILAVNIPPAHAASDLLQQTIQSLQGGGSRVFPPPTSVELAFSPDGGASDLVVKAIGSARQSVRVAAYSFTSKPIAQALADARQAGVDVELVIDHEQIEKRDHSIIPWLAARHIPVRVDIVHALQHDKYMVIDGKTVETGSFNYTSAAEQHNSENVLVLWNDPALAAAYAADWQRLWDQAEAYGG